jgi:hypothetical protein
MSISGRSVALLLAALFVGAAAGYVGGVLAVKQRFGQRRPRAERFERGMVLERLDRELNLTDEQERLVGAIMDSGHAALSGEGRRWRERTGAVRDSIRTEIEKVLDETQREKYRRLEDQWSRRFGRPEWRRDRRAEGPGEESHDDR